MGAFMIATFICWKTSYTSKIQIILNLIIQIILKLR